MQKAKVYDISGKESGEITLPAFFDTEINQELLHQVAKAQLANSRKAIANTKTRGQISGGGKKPWRQKGTGRARAGSSRSPLWRGGGITFGPSSDKNYSQKVNKKMAKLALLMSYAVKAQDKNLYVLDNTKFAEPKTKNAFSLLKQISIIGKSNLVAIAESEEVSRLAFRNIEKVFCKKPASISVTDLLKFKNLVISKEALLLLEKTFSDKTEEIKEKIDKKLVVGGKEAVVTEKKVAIIKKTAESVKETKELTEQSHSEPVQEPKKAVKKVTQQSHPELVEGLKKTVKKESKNTTKVVK